MSFRASDAELDALNRHARVLGISRTEVLRLSLQTLDTSALLAQRFEALEAGLREQIEVGLDTLKTELMTVQRRSLGVILQTLAASIDKRPIGPAVTERLNAIFGESKV
jgi:hypothetical protein